MNLDPEETASDKMGLNAAFQVEMEHAIEAIVNVEGLGDIMTAAPLDIVPENVYSGSSGIPGSVQKGGLRGCTAADQPVPVWCQFLLREAWVSPKQGSSAEAQRYQAVEGLLFQARRPGGLPPRHHHSSGGFGG